MKIVDLFESVSDVVYHATNIHNLADIVKSNRFNLSPAFAKGIEAHDKYQYYLSLSRTRTGSYHVDTSGYHALIELDGRKLNHRYASQPVDYWGPDFRRANRGAYEQEDRIFSNDSHIPNAMSYIKRVDLMVAERDFERTNKIIRELLMAFNAKGIPVRIYGSNRDWVTGSTQFMSIKEFLERAVPEVKTIPRTPDESERFTNRRNAQRGRSDLGLITKALILDDRESFSYDEWRALERYIHSMDAVSSISSELHNAYSDPKSRRSLEELGRHMRRMGLRDAKELANYLVTKWSRR